MAAPTVEETRAFGARLYRLMTTTGCPDCKTVLKFLQAGNYAWAASTFKSTLERFRRYPEIFEALLEFFGVEDPEKAGSSMKWHS